MVPELNAGIYISNLRFGSFEMRDALWRIKGRIKAFILKTAVEILESQ
jgi:hypothetical protein